MKHLETKLVAIADIDIGTSWRPLNDAWVTGLAAKIVKNGQKTPIELVVQKKGKPYRLVAGRHRIAALQLNGETQIRADIFEPEKQHASLYIELAELDENLDRQELNPLDRAVFIGRREEIYLQLHPETAQGKAGAAARHGHANEMLSFAEETAELIGLGVRAVQRATRIYKALDPETRKRLAGTPLANKEGELYTLASYGPEHQAQILDMCLRAEDPVASVRVAGDIVDGHRAKAPNPADQQYDKLTDTWKRATSAKARARFLADLVEKGIIPSFNKENLG